MAVQLTDTQIAALIAEPKPLAADYRNGVQPRQKRGHKERELDITGSNGSEFQVIVRESSMNALDFSVILGYLLPGLNVVFRLRRYNGKSHEHTNKIEGNKFYDFHIHYATERYQNTGFTEDAFAMITNRYNSCHGALNCMVQDCGFQLVPGAQIELL